VTAGVADVRLTAADVPAAAIAAAVAAIARAGPPIPEV
jgi:hypothetical protein